MNSSTHRSAPPNGARWLTQALEAEGVRTLFGYPGGTIMPFYDALVDSSLKHILVRHEQGAALAANGFARASNQVGVCVATSGPGASNLVTGIADAMLDSVPMVCITGQVGTPLLGTDAFQELDVFGLTMPIVKHSWLVRSVDDLPRVVADAFRIAREGRPGPVLIDLPKDVQLADASHLPAHVPSSVEPPPAPAEAAIAEAIAALAAAEKPVVYAGGGIALGDAVQDLRDFVEASAIPTVMAPARPTWRCRKATCCWCWARASTTARPASWPSSRHSPASSTSMRTPTRSPSCALPTSPCLATSVTPSAPCVRPSPPPGPTRTRGASAVRSTAIASPPATTHRASTSTPRRC